MVNGGRVACIATPLLFSLGSLVTLIFIFLAGTISKSNTIDDFYTLKINLTNLTVNNSSSSAALTGLSIIEGASSSSATSSSNLTALGNVLLEAKENLGVRDYYTIYLRSSCSWYAANESQYAECTTPAAFYSFDPIAAWNLNQTGASVESILPQTLTDGLSAYHNTAKTVNSLFAATLAAVVFSILVSVSAIFSRWGSFFTTIFAAIAAALFVSASAVATAVFVMLAGVLNTTLGLEYNVQTQIGGHWLGLSWMGAVFAVVAALTWLMSVCCCSGARSQFDRDNKTRRSGSESSADDLKRSISLVKSPYNYDRVDSPYVGGNHPPALATRNLTRKSLNTANAGHTPNGSAGPTPVSPDREGPYGNSTGGPYERFRSHQI